MTSSAKASTDGRGKHPNSRANLRPGNHPRPAASKPPEKSPETAPQPAGPLVAADQVVTRVDPVEGARQVVRNAAPAAAEQLVRLVNGSRRVDQRVQLAAIRTIFEVDGMLLSQPPQSSEQPEVTLAILERLSQALQLRRNAAHAEDAVVLPPTE